MNLKESIRNILKEETLKSILIDMIKNEGWRSVEKYVGGSEELKTATEIHNSVKFLKLFSDMEPIESEENPDIFIYRYKKGNNVMVVDKRDDDMRNIYVYVNYDLIYLPLSNFKESFNHYDRIKSLTRWLKTAYGIEGNYLQVDTFHPGSEDYGFWELLN